MGAYESDSITLNRIITHINDISKVITYYNISFNKKSPNYLCKNDYATDLCAFNLWKIGSRFKSLNGSTQKRVEKLFGENMILCMLNEIPSRYDEIDKNEIAAYASKLVSLQVLENIRRIIDDCKMY